MSAYTFGLAFICLMVAQAFLIAIPKNTISWEVRVIRYRWHEWFALTCVALCLLILLGGVLNRSSNNVSTSSNSEFQFESVFTVFMLGLLRSALDVDLPKNGKKPRGLWDAYLLGVGISLLIDFFVPEETSFIKIFKQPVYTWTGYGAVVLSAITYLAWIYSLLVRQMTLVHNFSGPVVNRFLVQSLLPEVPIQVVMIGPKKAGKSKITASVTGLDWNELKDTGKPKTGSFLTRLNNVKKTRVIGSMVDTPGESMGQHLAAAINYRTDSLALVLNSLALDVERLNGPQFSHLRQFANEAFLSSAMSVGLDIAQGSRDYIRILEAATSGASTAGENEDLIQFYKVHTLLLVIYNEKRANFNEQGNSNLKLISEEIGKLFGLKPQACNYVVLEVSNGGDVVSNAFTRAVSNLAIEL